MRSDLHECLLKHQDGSCHFCDFREGRSASERSGFRCNNNRPCRSSKCFLSRCSPRERNATANPRHGGGSAHAAQNGSLWRNRGRSRHTCILPRPLIAPVRSRWDEASLRSKGSATNSASVGPFAAQVGIGHRPPRPRIFAERLEVGIVWR